MYNSELAVEDIPIGSERHIVPDQTSALPSTILSKDAYDLIWCSEGSIYYQKFLRMAGIVQMLHPLSTPYGYPVLNTRMPTERERDSEIKRDHQPAWRPRFLDHGVPQEGSAYIIKAIVCTLALYGLYSLIFA